MSKRVPDIPSYQDRLLLEELKVGRSIVSGATTIKRLISKGWIEPEPDTNEVDSYRITQAGIDAIKQKNFKAS